MAIDLFDKPVVIDLYQDVMIFAYRVERDGDTCVVREYCDGEEIAEYSSIPRDMAGALIDELKERIQDAWQSKLSAVLKEAGIQNGHTD